MAGIYAILAHAKAILEETMFSGLRFLWNSTRGHRLAPWRSPYLLWRVETYCGVKMQNIGFLEFWGFLWRERANLKRFLAWTGEMQHYTRDERPGRSEPA
jgi:hypothetical protein